MKAFNLYKRNFNMYLNRLTILLNQLWNQKLGENRIKKYISKKPNDTERKKTIIENDNKNRINTQDLSIDKP